MKKFVVEDEVHAELIHEGFASFQEALDFIKDLSKTPWDEKPNKAPCSSWKTCGRNYHIIEYDATSIPYEELDTNEILSISAKGVEWQLSIE